MQLDCKIAPRATPSAPGKQGRARALCCAMPAVGTSYPEARGVQCLCALRLQQPVTIRIMRQTAPLRTKHNRPQARANTYPNP
eukprot:10302691-Alexandrium_andersonii.AAC.1